MTPIFRILALLCLAATIINIFKGLLKSVTYVVDTSDLGAQSNLHSNNSTIDLSGKIQTDSDRSKQFNTTDQNEDVLEDANPAKMAKYYPGLRYGGWYIPPNDTAREKVAIIVPYRDRRKHLVRFLRHMHPFLMKMMNQQIEYRVFVVEQEGYNRRFNRGKLFNVGFVESQKLGSWQCFICHDVDLLPLDRRLRYKCNGKPHHMSTSVSVFNKTLMYTGFGGVTAVTREQFMKVNGYSNAYWGWGGEDTDILRRLKIHYNISQTNAHIGRYVMLAHTPSKQLCGQRMYRLAKARIKYKEDGLSSLAHVVRHVTSHPLHTHIVANIDRTTANDLELGYIVDMLCGDTFL